MAMAVRGGRNRLSDRRDKVRIFPSTMLLFCYAAFGRNTIHVSRGKRDDPYTMSAMRLVSLNYTIMAKLQVILGRRQ